MSVARTCRRKRKNARQDKRYKYKGRDAGASARRQSRLVEKQKLMAMRKGQKKRK